MYSSTVVAGGHCVQILWCVAASACCYAPQYLEVEWINRDGNYQAKLDLVFSQLSKCVDNERLTEVFPDGGRKVQLWSGV